MATTENFLNGDGTTIEFSFSFPYIKTEDVRVELQEIDSTKPINDQIISSTGVTLFTIPSNNPTVIQFNSLSAATNFQAITGAPLANHAINTGNTIRIRIYRSTSTTATPATFFSGGAIRSQDLNNNFDSILYITQEKENELTEVIAGNIADGSITSSKLADQSVGTVALIDGSITSSKLADQSVGTAALIDGGVTPAKLDRAYVEKAGDTMTGDLTVPNIDTERVQADESVSVGTATVGNTGIKLDSTTATKPRMNFYSPSNATSGSIGLNYATAGVGSFAITTGDALQLGGNGNTYFSGVVSTTTASGPSFARLNSEGFGLRLYRSTSLRASKEDIRDLAAPSDLCKALRPVFFKSALEDDKKMFHGDEDQVGFIAEEVEQVHTGLCTYDGKELSGVAYDRVSAIAIGALKEAIARIEALEAQLSALQGGIGPTPTPI